MFDLGENHMKSIRRSLWPVLLSALCVLGPAAAQVSLPAAPSSGRSDLGALDLESLLHTKVITASKFSENLADAPGVILPLTSR